MVIIFYEVIFAADGVDMGALGVGCVLAGLPLALGADERRSK
jgi:hypothetical protein